MGGETHIFCPAYVEQEMAEILQVCDHISLTPFAQLEKIPGAGVESGEKLFHPHQSGTFTQGMASMIPARSVPAWASPGRTLSRKSRRASKGFISTLVRAKQRCALVETFAGGRREIRAFLHQMKWVNFGGGHHITRRIMTGKP